MTGFVVLKSLVRRLLGHARAVRTIAVTLAAAALLGTALAQPAHAAQDEQTLAEALAASERVPVIVVFDLPEFEADGLDGPAFDAAADARIARQRAIIERALGVSSATLAAPAAQGSPLRREYRSVAMVSMYLTADEINALLADPSVSDIQLDRPVPPMSNGTIPLIGANTLHSAGLTGAGSTIAILDTGVDHEHPMFSGRILESACFSSTVSTDSTSLCPAGAASDTTTADAGDDCAYTGDTGTVIAGCGHGTHVAGIAAGASFVDPGTGDTLIGVAPGANIVAVQVFSNFTAYCAGFGLAVPCALSYTSDQIAALDWLYTNRATLGLTSINMSLGGGNNTTFCNADSRYTVINNLRTANVATVIASGNNGYNNAVGAPGCIEPAITVGATDDSDVVASFSNSATMIDMLAPGVAINSAEPTINDTLPGRARSISGTSMATPHVAGAFALLRAANPSATVQDIETALENTGLSVTESPSNLVRPRIRVNLAHASLDTAAPTVSITGPSGVVTAAFTATFTFSENVTGFVVGDISASNATVSNFQATSASVYTATITPTAPGTVTLNVAGSAATDAAGNNNTAATQYSVTYAIPPRVSQIIRDTPAVSPTNADSLTWAVSFNTGVTNVSADDFTVSGTTASLGVIQDNAQSYRVTASGGDLASVNGTVTLGFAPGQNIQSTAGAALVDTSVTGSNQPTYTLDNTAPTVSISGPAGPVQGQFAATITFSEAVSGFASNEITLSNATLGSFSGSGTTYNANVTPSGDGTVTVDVAGGVATDSVGNGNTAATQFSVTADGTAPRVALIERQTPATTPTNANSVIWRVTFSEAVSNVDVGDFTVFGSTAGVTNVTNPSGNFWDVTVSGGDIAVMNGTITLGFAGGQNITDTAGNALTNTTPTGTNNNSFVIDNTAPALTAFARNTPAGEKTNADTLVFDISFNEAVANVSADDFTITGTTATGVLAGSGSAYTLTLSGGNLASLTGTVGLNLAAGQNITDSAGNALPAGEPGTDQTYDVRNTAPALASITRLTPATSPTNANSLVWQLNFSAIDSLFTLPANAFTVSGTTATVTNVERFSIGLYVTVSGGDLASLNGDVTLGLANTDFADDYGNVMDRTIPAGAELTYTVDNAAPTLAITPEGPVNAAFTATFTFSQAMTGFDASDVQVLNGAATNFAGSGAVYSATITPAAQGDVTVFVNFGSATDLAGNLMEGASRVVRFDSVAPAASLSGPSGTVNAAFDVAVQFTETVTGLAVGDFTVGNGTASNLTGSGFLYNVTITPAGDGPVTVDLAAGVANDAAGNGNTAATQFSVTMDATAPTVAIGVPTGPVNGAVTVTFTFSENVTGFSSGDIVATGANVSNFQSLSQSSYSARITPTASGTVNLSILAGTVTDLTSNPIALTTASFVADLTAPTLVVSGPAGPVSGAFTATFTFSESVTGFDAGDLLLSRGTASNFAGSGAVYTATITPNQEGQVLIFVPAEVASDAAGNLNSSGNYGVTYDATAPRVVSITRLDPAGSVTNQDYLRWQVVFSEGVSNLSPEDFDPSGTTAGVNSIIALSASAPVQAAASDDGIFRPFAVSDTTFYVTVSGGDLAGLNGNVALAFAAGQNITDRAGNALVNTTPTGANESYTLDNTAPTVSISSSASAPVTGPFQITVSFNEDVTGFDLSDLTVGNGAASNFSATDARTYTATITPVVTGNVTVDVTTGAAQDTAGNGSGAATQFALAYNGLRTLSVDFSGLGGGRIVSNPAGLDCSADCNASIEGGRSYALSVTPNPDSVFAVWTSGPCAGRTDAVCTVDLTTNASVGALFQLASPPQARIMTATLPGARSGYMGGAEMSALLSVSNGQQAAAQNCYVSNPTDSPVTLTSARLDGSGNPTGPLNPYFDLLPGESANFVLGMTPNTQTGPSGYLLYPLVTCQNAGFIALPGINSILLSIGSAPVPDVLSTSATPSGDGVIRIAASGRAQVMTAAAVNIGAGDGSAGANEATLTASVDTGSAALPVMLEMCQINASALCITPRGPSVTTVVQQNAAVFYAVFVRDASGGAGIPFDPANARVYLRFTDAGGTVRSVASAAVTAPAAADIPVASAVPSGRWSVVMRRHDGGWPDHVSAAVHVAGNGVAIIDDGMAPRLAVFDPVLDTEVPGRFRQAGTDGRWTSEGTIRLGAVWADHPGEFWGVRDARSDSAMQWRDLAGAYGGSVHILETGEIRGIAGGCAVYGQASGAASSVMVLSLTGCAMSGSYAAVIDLPANDNEAPVLVIAGQSAGWRLAQ
ncbi:Ig-like domain-containing protein [Hyphobacterium sp. SN044]|uniref:Ig-like domain-containing protein n=1 Tax=Hyphobacterium sp. SN044 TaxID=2912575 RepID=UPI001F1BC0DE|nr:Ig-like domain-containing protein [Hyphobacterium sp. SN044]MCF8880041.1 Ig-like domain-containing protein [Hyphobacterium sp. SN044]